jgi:hypothetical protein
MTKVRRGGYLFLTWIGDHPPRHVHVLRNGRRVLKWDLERRRPLQGVAVRRLVDVIDELVNDGRL